MQFNEQRLRGNQGPCFGVDKSPPESLLGGRSHGTRRAANKQCSLPDSQQSLKVEGTFDLQFTDLAGSRQKS
jgi:hypothetical protein